MNVETGRILSRDEIYQTLIHAITEKRPLPPADWDLVKLEEEIRTATAQYDPNPLSRQQDALLTAVYYLVDFAVRMPEWIETTAKNERVEKTCRELAEELIKITEHPDEIIAERGKLKSWLKAILAVNTSLIYVEETEKAVARDREAKRLRQAASKNDLFSASHDEPRNQQTALAKNIWSKAQSKVAGEHSEQQSLF